MPLTAPTNFDPSLRTTVTFPKSIALKCCSATFAKWQLCVWSVRIICILYQELGGTACSAETTGQINDLAPPGFWIPLFLYILGEVRQRKKPAVGRQHHESCRRPPARIKGAKMNTQIPVRQSLAELSLDDLTDKMAEMGNSNIQTCQAEFLRRQTVLQAEATCATKDTADYTRRNARYMLWSVIVLAISSVISTMVTVAVALLHH